VSNGVRHYEIPVGSAIAMYVKRKVTEDIGYFDEAFGRGYEKRLISAWRALETWVECGCHSILIIMRNASTRRRAKNSTGEEKTGDC